MFIGKSKIFYTNYKKRFVLYKKNVIIISLNAYPLMERENGNI